MRRAQRQRPDLQRPHRALRGAIEPERRTRRAGTPPGEQKRYGVVPGPPQRELEQEGRRRIQPLDVVNRDQERFVPREDAQGAQECNRNGPRLRRRATAILEQQRRTQCPTLRNRKQIEETPSVRAKQIARGSKRKLGFGLGRTARERLNTSLPR